MFDPKSPDLPKEWQEESHYAWRIDWLTNTPSKEQLEDVQERLQMMLEHGASAESIADSFANPKGFLGLEGWFSLFPVTGVLIGSAQPLAEIKKFVVNSDFRGGEDFLKADLERPAPTHVYKKHRKALLALIETEFEKNSDSERRSTVMLPIDDHHALCIFIDTTLIPPQVRTGFANPANPIRSFVGREFAVSTLAASDEDWQLLAQGVLEISENTVQIGEWTSAFAPELEVFGMAFCEAWLYQDDVDTYFGFHLAKYHAPDIESYEALYDDDGWIR